MLAFVVVVGAGAGSKPRVRRAPGLEAMFAGESVGVRVCVCLPHLEKDGLQWLSRRCSRMDTNQQPGERESERAREKESESEMERDGERWR